MDWVLPITTLDEQGRKEYSTKVMEEIRREYSNG